MGGGGGGGAALSQLLRLSVSDHRDGLHPGAERPGAGHDGPPGN